LPCLLTGRRELHGITNLSPSLRYAQILRSDRSKVGMRERDRERDGRTDGRTDRQTDRQKRRERERALYIAIPIGMGCPSLYAHPIYALWHVFSRGFTVLPAQPHVHPQSE